MLLKQLNISWNQTQKHPLLNYLRKYKFSVGGMSRSGLQANVKVVRGLHFLVQTSI
jgi:hypothetical protein